MIQNIRFLYGNMVRVDGYFYSFDHSTDTMIKKTDDGTLAFAYPLDTPIAREIIDFSYDGESWWTMEHISATPSAGFYIKRWVIENFVMVLQQTFSFGTNTNDTFDSDAFAIEKYETLPSNFFNGGQADQLTLFQLSAPVFAQITAGTHLFLGPSTRVGFEGALERVTVSSANEFTKTVTLTSGKVNEYTDGVDNCVFSKNIWFFNQNHLQESGVGSLYKANILDGNILSRTKGGAFKDIGAADFADLTGVFSGATLSAFNLPSYLIFIRTNNLLFIDVLDPQLTTSLSAIQNNLSPDTIEVYTIYDLGLEGDTLFRLQKKFNVNGAASTESTYNYQLATFKPFPTAIALSADTPILPADSGNSDTDVHAYVTDQYALPYVQDVAATITFQTDGGGAGSGLTEYGPIALDADGHAKTNYFTGNTAGLVTISAEVTI